MPVPRASPLALTALAGTLHLALDLASLVVPWIAPPYLLLDHAGEAFRVFLEGEWRAPVLGTVAVVSSVVNGIIAALMAVALEGHPRRRRVLAWTLAALWLLGGGLLVFIYLTPPWPLTAASLLAGVPRAWLIAWALDRLLRASPADPGEGAGPHPA